jgi:hypothetical protein
MDPDFALVVGLLLAWLAIPSIVSAYSDRRAPRVSAILVVIAGGLVLYALRMRPEGYHWSDIPEAFVRVAAWVLN